MLLSLVAGCGGASSPSKSSASSQRSPSATASKKVRIGFSLLSAANSYSQAEVQGARAIASKMNATVQVLNPNWDANVQRNQIQDAVASHQYDALVVMANDGAVLIPAVKQAIAAGVKVAAAFSPIGPDPDTLQPQIPGLTTTVGPRLVEVGQMQGEATVQACAGKNPCRVLFMGGELTLISDKEELLGFKQVVSKAANISLTTRSAGAYLASNGRNTMADYLQTTHDVDVVTTLGDQIATGVEQALSAARVKGVDIIGLGGSALGVKAVIAGHWYATGAQYPQTEGRLATEYAIDAVRGKKVPQEEDVYSVAPINGAVTRKNAAKFTPQWQQ